MASGKFGSGGGFRGGMMGGGMMGGGGMSGGYMGGGGMMGQFPGGGMASGKFGSGGGFRGGMMGGGMQGMPGGGGGAYPSGGGKQGVNSAPGNAQGAAPTADLYQPHWVYAYIELHGKVKPWFDHKKKEKPLTHLEFDHAWGQVCRVPVDLIRLPYRPDDNRIENQVVVQPTVAEQYASRLRDAKKRKDPVAVLRVAEWALEHGMTCKFHALMTALRKVNDASGVVKAALAKYDRVKAAMEKPPAGEEVGNASLLAELTREGYRVEPSTQGHYVLVSNLPPERKKGLQRRLALMEETYEKFFYWFALHSTDLVPPVPTRRLLAMVVANPAEFHQKHAAWGWVSLVGDGFLPRRDNVMILSAEHLDESYALLKKNNQEQLHGLKKDDLLSGAVWKLGEQKDFAKYAYLQTTVLVEKAMQTEAERATISHAATRQLLFATGLLPRHVDVPEWIQYGLSSFFETPAGAFYPGMGLPSWTNLLKFKYYDARKRLQPRGDVLLRVVTDRYFRKAGDSDALLNEAKDSFILAARAQDDRAIAQSTAWALVYYLAKENKLGLLLQYSRELDGLPRDLELSERVLRGCFTRAFGAADSPRLQRFADAWFSAMSADELEIPQYGRDYLGFLLQASAAQQSKGAAR
jgi:hypothetical protein